MGTKNKNKIEIIIEKSDGMLWGRVEGKGNYLPTPYGTTIEKVIKNLIELIEDYQAHEGKGDPFWNAVDINKLEVSFAYDLTAFFQEKKFLNLSGVADRAGINRSLMAQYAAGIKYPSQERAKKIEEAIHSLGNELRAVQIAVKDTQRKIAQKSIRA